MRWRWRWRVGIDVAARPTFGRPSDLMRTGPRNCRFCLRRGFAILKTHLTFPRTAPLTWSFFSLRLHRPQAHFLLACFVERLAFLSCTTFNTLSLASRCSREQLGGSCDGTHSGHPHNLLSNWHFHGSDQPSCDGLPALHPPRPRRKRQRMPTTHDAHGRPSSRHASRRVPLPLRPMHNLHTYPSMA